MSNFFTVILDTTAPASPSLQISGGAVYAQDHLVTLDVSVADGVTTNYQMKIWGDVDNAFDTNIQTTEGASQWFTYSTSPQVRLSTAQGSKTLNLRVRDSVWNQSSIAVDSITLDTALPVVTANAPDTNIVSKIAGKNTFSFSFSVNENYLQYKVCRVNASGASHDAGTVIPTTGGSTATSGNAGYTSGQVINVSVTGQDLEGAGQTSDGNCIIKIFVQEDTGNWSV